MKYLFFCEYQGALKLRWKYKSIVVYVNLLESIYGAIAVVLLCLFPTDHPISVEINAKEVLHCNVLNQMVVETAVGL